VIGAVPATGDLLYEVTAPTECDAGGSDTCWTYFCVTAHTGFMGEHFDSAVKRGYSVDNGGMAQPPGADDDRYDASQADDRSVVLRTPTPNPAGRSFLIEFELAATGEVDLAVYDVRGRRKADLAGGILDPGLHAVRWDPGSARSPEVPPGLYFIRLAAARQLHTAKVVLIK
jgi:hypothetical protein